MALKENTEIQVESSERMGADIGNTWVIRSQKKQEGSVSKRIRENVAVQLVNFGFLPPGTMREEIFAVLSHTVCGILLWYP
jgi:hypothetical protein